MTIVDKIIFRGDDSLQRLYTSSKLTLLVSEGYKVVEELSQTNTETSSVFEIDSNNKTNFVTTVKYYYETVVYDKDGNEISREINPNHYRIDTNPYFTYNGATRFIDRWAEKRYIPDLYGACRYSKIPKKLYKEFTAIEYGDYNSIPLDLYSFYIESRYSNGTTAGESSGLPDMNSSSNINKKIMFCVKQSENRVFLSLTPTNTTQATLTNNRYTGNSYLYIFTKGISIGCDGVYYDNSEYFYGDIYTIRFNNTYYIPRMDGKMILVNTETGVQKSFVLSSDGTEKPIYGCESSEEIWK